MLLFYFIIKGILSPLMLNLLLDIIISILSLSGCGEKNAENMKLILTLVLQAMQHPPMK